MLVPDELRGVLDLFPGQPDPDPLLLHIDTGDGTRGEEDLLAEDPRAGVHDQIGRSRLVGVLVDLSDAAVGRLHPVAGQVHVRDAVNGDAVGPDVLRHDWNSSLHRSRAVTARLPGAAAVTHPPPIRSDAP